MCAATEAWVDEKSRFLLDEPDGVVELPVVGLTGPIVAGTPCASALSGMNCAARNRATDNQTKLVFIKDEWCCI